MASSKSASVRSINGMVLSRDEEFTDCIWILHTRNTTEGRIVPGTISRVRVRRAPVESTAGTNPAPAVFVLLERADP
jgi:hypothetical protein